MSTEILIKKVTKTNFDSFINLLEKMALFEDQSHPDSAAKKRLKEDALSKNPKYEAFIANLGSQDIGFMIIYPTYSSFLALPSLFLEDIFVLKEFRKQRIGQKMFDYCVKLAKDRDCGRMEWWTLNWNMPAINFYKKNNATRTNNIFYQLSKKQIDEHVSNS